MIALRRHIAIRAFAWRGLCLLLACNYFAFRTELCREEEERNRPVVDPFSNEVAYGLPSVNWETFDKDNAPKAIVVQPWLTIQFLFPMPDEQFYSRPVHYHAQLIRDKSPPVTG